MKQLALGAIVLLVTVLLPSSALGVLLGDINTAQAVCASDTMVYILPVTNDGGQADSFTVSLSGDAAKWAVAAPAGFVLGIGKTESVYIYVTPSIRASVGNYKLDVLVNSAQAGQSAKTLNVVVSDCHSVAITAESNSAESCSCQPKDIKFSLSNTGKYAESFAVSLSGPAAKYAASTLGEVKLASKETREFTVAVNTPCNVFGKQDLTVTASSKDSSAVSIAQVAFNSLSCYGFDVQPDKNYMSFCENSEVKIPIAIKNSGAVDNTFSLALAGPSWATLESTSISLIGGRQGTANLILFPGFGISGDFKAKVKVTDSKSQTSVEKEITANVLKCHDTDVKIAAEEDTVCPFTSKAYEVSLANNGKYNEDYAITVAGADFATLDKNFIPMVSGKTQKLNLIVSPKDVASDIYTLQVKAESQGPSRTTSTDTLRVRVAPKEACFGVKTDAALTNVKVAYGEGALVPVVVENKGKETSTFNLEVSGSGAGYGKMNPGTVTLKGGEAQTVYLYVAVPIDAQQKNYLITVGARLKDGTVSSSSTVDVFVVKQGEEITKIVPTNPIGTNKENRTALNIGAALSPAKDLLARAYAKFKAISRARGFNFRLPHIPTLSEVKARAKADLSLGKAKASNAVDLITGKASLALPKVTTPSLVTDTLKQTSKADKDLRSRFSNIFRSAFAPVTPIISKVKAYEAKAIALAKKETFGYKNWMIGGAGLIVLIVLIGLITAMPRKEGKGILGGFWDWLEEEDEMEEKVENKPVDVKPAEAVPAVQPEPAVQQKKSLFARFMAWLEEDGAPKQEQQQEPASTAVQPERPAAEAQTPATPPQAEAPKAEPPVPKPKAVKKKPAKGSAEAK